MYNNDYENSRLMFEEERRLLHEIDSQRMSWHKLGKMFRLNALLRHRDREPYNYF